MLDGEMQQRYLKPLLFITFLFSFIIVNAQENLLYERLFEDGCKWRGSHYVKVRQALENQGEKILLFLEKKKASKDFNENIFARILINRIKAPKAAEKWRQEILKLVPFRNSSTYDGIDKDKLPEKVEDIPSVFMVDMFWAHSDSIGNHPYDFPLLLAIQYYMNPDLETMRAAFDVLPSQYSIHHFIREGTAKLGLKSAPFLRSVLAEIISLNPEGEYDFNGSEEVQDQWKVYRNKGIQSETAADLLVNIKDKKSIPLLHKCLKIYPNYNNYIEKISSHLASFKALEAINTMLDFTLDAVEQKNLIERHDEPGYLAMRSHILKLGKGAIPVLKKSLKNSTREIDRIIINSFILELSGIKGQEARLAKLKEEALIDPTAERLLLLNELTKEDVFERLVALTFMNNYDVSFPVDEQNERKIKACLALGILNDQRAVPLFQNEIKKLHVYLLKQLNGKDIKTFNAQRVRETGYAYGSYNTNLSKILSWGDACILALQKITHPEAMKALMEICKFPEYKALAETALLFKDDPEEVVKLLSSKSSEKSENASLVLFDHKDSRAVYELLRATARRQGEAHLVWKRRALSLKANKVALLEKLEQSQDLREQVLGRSMMIEIQDPDRAKKCEKLLLEAAERVSMMHYQKIGMVEDSGQALAKQIQKEDISMIQSKCLFGFGVIRRGVAAFALGEHRSDTSMQVLAQSMNMGSMGGSSPPAIALFKYGEKAKELIAKTPTPSPGQHDTGLRVTMHRYGTRVLAEQKDVRGVEELLKGIETLSKDRSLDRWQYRLGIYLGAAKKYQDKRLVNPLLELLDITGISNNTEKILELLSFYDDKRLNSIFVNYLSSIDLDGTNFGAFSLYKVAAKALSRRLKSDIGDFLIQKLKGSDSIKERRAILFTLASLSYEYSPYPAPNLWERKSLDANTEILEISSAIHKLAFPIMLKAIKDPNPQINKTAALCLTILSEGSEFDKVPAKPSTVPHLNAWSKNQNKVFYTQVEFMEKYGNKETEEIFLQILKSQPPNKGNTHLIHFLGKKKTRGAVSVLARNLLAISLKGVWLEGCPELSNIVHFGEEGAKALFDLIKKVEDINCKVIFAERLGELQCKPASGDLHKLLKGILVKDWKKLGFKMKNGNGREAYFYRCETLFKALYKCDPKLAKKEAAKVLLNGPEMLKLLALDIWASKPSE